MTHSTSMPVPISQSIDAPKVMAFEIEHEGHYAGYILNLARYWHASELPGRIDFVVTQTFCEWHTDVVDEIGDMDDSSVRLIPLTRLQTETILPGTRPKYAEGWKVYCEYARALQPEHALLMYFDFFQIPVIFGQKSPCPFSCLYFRPTFHYHEFSNYQPSWSEKFRAFRKKLVLKRVLKNRQLKNLFCLDPFAAEYIQKNFSASTKIIHLPDPVKIYQKNLDAASNLHDELGIEPGRTVFLLLGVLDRRKGVIQTLQAISQFDAEFAKKVCLLLAGPVQDTQRERVTTLVKELNHRTNAQIVLRDEFVQDRVIQNYYQLADVVLAPYQKHMGMSAALIRSAAAETPVLASNYGLAGELTLRRKLGISVDTTDPAEIAKGMQRLQADPLGVCEYDFKNARNFVQENSPENTSRTIFSEIVPCSPVG